MSVFVSQEVSAKCLQKTGDFVALLVYLLLIKFNVCASHLFASTA